MSSQTTDRPHVLILGAGLGGLTLAQGLRKQGLTYEIFERDVSLHSRFQGWAITLHMILKEMKAWLPGDLPPIEVVDHLQPLDLPSEVAMHGKNGSVNRVESGNEYHFIRANRTRLRDWLSTKIDVKWDKHLTRIEEHDSKVTVHFSDGTSATGDVLVGCDGVKSVVRSHLFNGEDKLKNVPVTLVTGEPTLNKEQYERQMKLGRSVYTVNNDPERLFVGLNSVSGDAQEAKYYWFYNITDDPNRPDQKWVKSNSKQELYDGVVKETEAFPSELSEIIRLTKPEEIKLPPIVLRDMIMTEMPNRHVTLLGDAAHPMTPFRGEGGNQAMIDAINLSKALGEARAANLIEVLKGYQDEMMERGSSAVKKSRDAVFDDGSGTLNSWQSWKN